MILSRFSILPLSVGRQCEGGQFPGSLPTTVVCVPEERQFLGIRGNSGNVSVQKQHRWASPKYNTLGPVLWYSRLHQCLPHWHPISECPFESQLPWFSLLLMCPGNLYKMAQVLGPTWETHMEYQLLPSTGPSPGCWEQSIREWTNKWKILSLSFSLFLCVCVCVCVFLSVALPFKFYIYIKCVSIRWCLYFTC